MAEGKVRCIIKRPDEKYGHVTNISTTLKNLQNIVEGPIETVSFGKDVLIVNEEGKLRGLERNFKFGEIFFDIIVGTAILIGQDGEDFGDVHMDFKTWKSLLGKWGN